MKTYENPIIEVIDLQPSKDLVTANSTPEDGGQI